MDLTRCYSEFELEKCVLIRRCRDCSNTNTLRGGKCESICGKRNQCSPNSKIKHLWWPAPSTDPDLIENLWEALKCREHKTGLTRSFFVLFFVLFWDHAKRKTFYASLCVQNAQICWWNQRIAVDSGGEITRSTGQTKCQWWWESITFLYPLPPPSLLLSGSFFLSPETHDHSLNWNSCHATAPSFSLAHMLLYIDMKHTMGDVISSKWALRDCDAVWLFLRVKRRQCLAFVKKERITFYLNQTGYLHALSKKTIKTFFPSLFNIPIFTTGLPKNLCNC